MVLCNIRLWCWGLFFFSAYHMIKRAKLVWPDILQLVWKCPSVSSNMAGKSPNSMGSFIGKSHINGELLSFKRKIPHNMGTFIGNSLVHGEFRCDSHVESGSCGRIWVPEGTRLFLFRLGVTHLRLVPYHVDVSWTYSHTTSWTCPEDGRKMEMAGFSSVTNGGLYSTCRNRTGDVGNDMMIIENSYSLVI